MKLLLKSFSLVPLLVEICAEMGDLFCEAFPLVPFSNLCALTMRKSKHYIFVVVVDAGCEVSLEIA